MTESVHATLTLPELQKLTADFCRSRKRSAFYRDAAWGPVGILVRRLLDERNALLERRRIKPMRQQDLVAACTHHAPESTIKEFLNGNTPGDQEWGKLAVELVEIILGIDRTGDLAEPEDEQRLSAASDIVRYFFANNPHADLLPDHPLRDTPDESPKLNWYFTGSIPTHPTSTRELLAEWRVIAERVRTRRYTQASMLRVVAAHPVTLVDEGQWTPTGAQLIELVKAGVRQTFVLPTNDLYGIEPRHAAVTFRQLAAQELGDVAAGLIRLVNVDPSGPGLHAGLRTRYPSEFFHPHLGYTAYRWLDLGKEVRTVQASRHPRHGPVAFEFEHNECRAFAEWENLFIPRA